MSKNLPNLADKDALRLVVAGIVMAGILANPESDIEQPRLSRVALGHADDLIKAMNGKLA